MGVLDSAILLGKETTYGTPATLTRGYEGHADALSRQVEYLESTGFRPGLQTIRSDRRKPVLQGAEGDLEVDFLNRGMGLFFDLAFGATSGPTQIGTTGVYETTFTTNATGPVSSATVQVIRSTVEASTQPFTYHGCMATSWTLAAEAGGLVMATLSFDAEDEDTSTAAGTPSYPANARPFDWTQVVVKVDGTPVDFSSFSVEAGNGLKTDRRFLRGSALKKKPVRSEVPELTGTLNGEFRDTDLYSKFVNGDVVALTITATGDTIGATASNFGFELSLPAVMLDGSTPAAALDDVTSQEVPFRVLWDGTNAAASLKITSDDSAL